MNQTLQHIMNDMAQGVCRVGAKPSVAPQQITELEGFAHFDPLLASLVKEYETAKTNRLKLVRENGAEDAMAQMAIDMEDSCWCAMQTRYLELREDIVLMKRVQQRVYQAQLAREAYEIEQAERREFKEKLALAEYVRLCMECSQRAKEQNKPVDILEFLVLFLVFEGDFMGARPENHAIKLAA